MKRRLLVGLAGAALACGVLAAPASAHPLGNFSVNHLSQVRFDEREAELTYILDQAEIPTFQEAQRFDSNGDGAITGAESDAVLERKLAEIEPGLSVTADGRPLALSEPDATISFPEGSSGLATTRVEAIFNAALPAGADEIALSDDTYRGRVGWKAVQVLPGEGADVVSSAPATDPTDGLTAYPEDLLETPADETEATFSVSPGTGRVEAPDGITGGEAASDRGGGGGFAELLTSGDAHGALVIVLFLAAFAWGALHALSPGHGKSMVAAYLAGSDGRTRHAAILGLSLTASHTISVFALGAVTLLLSAYVLPEDLYPWLGVASGAIVIGVGLWVMRSRIRRWRGHGHHHHHHHGEAEGEPVTTRSLLALGAAGGIVPCPSALVVLIAAISQHRVGLGMALIVAFSLGLAATLTGLGIAVLHGVRAASKMEAGRRLLRSRYAGALPAISASAIVVVGTVIAIRAATQI